MTSPSPQVLRCSAFTDGGRGGNPAGVVLDAAAMRDGEMLDVARSVGFSETAFPLPQGEDRAAIRYFSPRDEVAFCGHATIATAVALAERQGPGVLHLVTPADAGNRHPVVGVATLDRLAAFDYDYDELAALMEERGWTTVHVFRAESTEHFHARNAFPPGGVVEDPATGAGRPSRLLVDLDPASRTVDVSGTATEIPHG